MKTTTFPTPTGIVRSTLATLAAFAVWQSGVTANAQTLNFTPNAPLLTENYAGLNEGDSVTTLEGWSLAWSGSPAVLPEVNGSAPGGTGYPSENGLVLTNPTGTRGNVTSASLALPDLSSSSVVYASGWFYHSSQNTSGARVLLRYLEGTTPKYVGGFGILDGSTTTNGAFSIFGGSGWSYSTEKAEDNHWYEIALVVQLGEDLAESKGYLFVRDATSGETEFRLIEDIAGIDMGYSSTHQFDNFNTWRVEGFQSQAQLGALSVGIGTLEVIPEPGTVSLLLLSGLAVGGYRLYRQKLSVR